MSGVEMGNPGSVCANFRNDDCSNYKTKARTNAFEGFMGSMKSVASY
jgi:hypothetical protein